MLFIMRTKVKTSMGLFEISDVEWEKEKKFFD